MAESKCPLCSGPLKVGPVPYGHAGVPLGRFEAETCGRCGEAFFTEPAWRRIEQLARERGLWASGRHATVGTSGHSLIVRIPPALAASAELAKGSHVFIQPAGKGRLLIEREGR